MEAALPTYRGGVSTREQVKAALAAFAAAAPGRSVEIRVPPYGAVQAVPGGAHRRGTPCAGRVRRRDLAGTGAGTWAGTRPSPPVGSRPVVSAATCRVAAAGAV